MKVESATVDDVRITFCGKRPKFDSVWVERDGDRSEIFWNIAPVGGPTLGTPLGEVRYGVPPAGWEGSVATPLRRGDRIYVLASGKGHHGGIAVTVE